MVPVGEGARFWKGSFIGIEGFSLFPTDSSLLPGSVPEAGPSDGAAVGMKNLAPPTLAGLADGAIGGWNIFVEVLLPPLLKVSTYLPRGCNNEASISKNNNAH